MLGEAHIRSGLLSLGLIPSLLASSATRSVTVEELGGLVAKGEKVRVLLKSGAYGEGIVEEITAAALKVQVRRSDNRSELPPGLSTIGAERLAGVTRCIQKGNKRTNLPLILVSTLGTLSLIAAGATEELKPTYVPLALGFTVGLGAGGYYAGRRLDRHCTAFVVR